MPALVGFRLASLVPVALLPRVPAFTLPRPRAVAWALLCLRGGGSGACLWVCLLVGWVAGVWCLRYCCVRLGCLRFLGVGVLDWGGGVVWLRPFLLSRLVCVFALLAWVCWRVRGSVCLMGGGRPGRGRDNVVPPPTAWRVVPSCCVLGERGVVCGVLVGC